ncbi:hypothetical protein CN645_27080 [Burkholderia sp. IDO3]|nr:hypothetical protein DCN14_29670 [Burkholderia sp. IDO3]PCD58713.1 hypothetical protein CN645_27080 [Burkholderia sp. IDO3]
MRARQPIAPAAGGGGGAGSLLIEIKAIILNRFTSVLGRLYVGFMAAVELLLILLRRHADFKMPAFRCRVLRCGRPSLIAGKNLS